MTDSQRDSVLSPGSDDGVSTAEIFFGVIAGDEADELISEDLWEEHGDIDMAGITPPDFFRGFADGAVEIYGARR